MRPEDANLDEYIIRRALDAVYATMADEERTTGTLPGRHTQKALRSASGAR